MKNQKKKIKNPLRKRWHREIRQDKGKYIALFLFLFVSIAFVSGFLVGDNSLKKAYNESFKKYNIEDGHFSLGMKADKATLEKIRKEKVVLQEQFFKDEAIKKNHSIRVFEDRKKINKECMMKGYMPENKKEIVVDRLYAENNKLKIGDNIRIAGKDFKVSGFVALPDYSCLYKRNSDMMFDANKFTIGVVTKEGFKRISNRHIEYQYTWTDKKGVDYDDLKRTLEKTGILTDYLEEKDNNAITFTGKDLGSDKMMMIVLLYVVIVVIGFVFGVTVRGIIEKESIQIGTLRAGGFTKWELLLHYIKLPVFVTVLAAIVGNILGYTFMKGVVVNLYYHSYSLTTYSTRWTPEAFILTTVIPGAMIFIVVFAMLYRMLSIEPLRFIRKDLHSKNRNKVMKLPNWKFMNRFRFRVIAQNKGAYFVLFIGILLASLMMIFGLLMSPLLNHFKTDVLKSNLAEHQYILKAPLPTSTKKAEKYCVRMLNIKGREDATVYGIKRKSRYLKNTSLPKRKNEVLISDGYAEKYKIKKGDRITLKKKNGEKKYSFRVVGIKEYSATLAIFMEQKNFNKAFGEKKTYFNGYFSDKKIKDIDEMYIATEITHKDLTVVADQLQDSMGAFFPWTTGFALIIYVLLMYVLSKFIIEKNKNAISLLRILGYSGAETARIYNNVTAIVVAISLILSLPLARLTMKMLYYSFMGKINGWLTYYVEPYINVAMVLGGGACYLLVHMIQSRGFNKMNMSDAIKRVE